MSRELTIAWAKRNCPDPRVVKGVTLRLDEAAAAGGHLLLVVGKRLTRSRMPYLVVSHRREMLAFGKRSTNPIPRVPCKAEGRGRKRGSGLSWLPTIGEELRSTQVAARSAR